MASYLNGRAARFITVSAGAMIAMLAIPAAAEECLLDDATAQGATGTGTGALACGTDAEKNGRGHKDSNEEGFDVDGFHSERRVHSKTRNWEGAHIDNQK